jgi:hypothetical protein
VRKRITVGTLQAHKEGTAWVVLLPATTGVVLAELAAQEAVPQGGPERVMGGTTVPAVDLTPLVAMIERKDQEIQRLNDAAMAWQFRALRAEERLSALESGPISSMPQDAKSGPLRGDRGEMASEPMPRASDSLALRWRAWWRRMRGG